MIEIAKDLDPCRAYSFQTDPSGRTFPMTVKEFLGSKFGGEKIITVDDGFGPDSNRVWSTYEGWSEKHYISLVRSFIELIDSGSEVTNEFICQSMKDGLGVQQTVTKWFFGTEIYVEISHFQSNASDKETLKVIIQGVGSVRFVIMPMHMQPNSQVFINHGLDQRDYPVWEGDLLRTINGFFEKIIY